MMRTRPGWILLILMAPGPFASGQERPREPYDLVIRGGKIVDGTGNPWFKGDLAIRGDRIAAVGRLVDDSPPGGSSTRAARRRARGSSTCTRIPTGRCSKTAPRRARSARG